MPSMSSIRSVPVYEGRRSSCSTLAIVLTALVWSSSAQAQFSARDGYTTDGQYRVQTELMPYVWLPATSGTAHLGPPNAGRTVSINAGVPTTSQLSSVLDAAFMGAGLVRYGPFSVELDMQWVNASTSHDRPVPGSLATIRTDEAASLFRIAPGLGLQVVASDIGGVPVSLDARVGFSYNTAGASADPSRLALRGFSHNSSFVQPWVGLRFDVYPSPAWRIELGGLAQGFGFDGGSWGWGASAIVSYLVTDWLDLSLGFRALNTQRFGGRDEQRSLNLTEYGPLIGMGFRF
jgi:hypothetical protein